MPRILEIAIPPDRTAAVLAQIEATEGLIGYRVEPRASSRPAGDVVALTMTNRSLHPLLRSLEQRRLLEGSGWSIAINEPAGLIAPASRHDIDNDDNEVTWEAMDFTILRESNMTINSLLVTMTSGVLATTGMALRALHLVIAAMVIAPGFEPINRVRVTGERALNASRAIRGFVFALVSWRVPTAYQGGIDMATRFDTQRIHEQREATEGPATRGTESVTARLPSGVYLAAAISAMAGSAVLQAIGKQRLSLFVGQWAPSLLIMGLYNKLVKVAGSD